MYILIGSVYFPAKRSNAGETVNGNLGVRN